MKRITLVCKTCPTRETFVAMDTDGLLERIDGSGWATLSSPDLPRGTNFGRCPACNGNPGAPGCDLTKLLP